MNIRAWLTAAAGAVVLLGMTVGSAHAAGLTAIAVLGGDDSTDNVFYTPGPSGGLTIDNNTEFLQGKLGQGYDGDVTASFTNMTNGSYVYNANGTFDQQLNPNGAISSFVVTDNTNNTVLLSGTFGGADLTGTNASSSGNVNLELNDVTYTGGTFFPAGYSPTNGSLSVEFTSTAPFSASASGLAAFDAVDGVTFSAPAIAAVPEPASMASFAVGGLLLLGALLSKRRVGSAVAAA